MFNTPGYAAMFLFILFLLFLRHDRSGKGFPYIRQINVWRGFLVVRVLRGNAAKRFHDAWPDGVYGGDCHVHEPGKGGLVFIWPSISDTTVPFPYFWFSSWQKFVWNWKSIKVFATLSWDAFRVSLRWSTMILWWGASQLLGFQPCQETWGWYKHGSEQTVVHMTPNDRPKDYTQVSYAYCMIGGTRSNSRLVGACIWLRMISWQVHSNAWWKRCLEICNNNIVWFFVTFESK